MIEYGSGDLLGADTDALINTVNTVGVMGKGIALQFKRRYPELFAAYQKACRRGEVQIGRMWVFETGQLGGPRYIVNFPTKQHWRSPSQLSYIDAGLLDLVQVIKDLGITSIAVPPLGAGNGGLDWAEVEPRITAALTELPEVRTVLYAPAGGVRAIAAPTTIRMTAARALLLEAMRRYLQRRRGIEPWEDPTGVSHLEIQKLMYFANLVDPTLKLDFATGRYGPYSEKVRHLLAGMEGAYTTGFGDGSAKALQLDPIAVTPLGERALADYFAANPDQAQRIAADLDVVLAAIDGFEGPYGVELLASTHWVATQQNARDPQSAATTVRQWTKRKGRIYTDDRVTVALTRVLETERDLQPLNT
ncbi:MAG: macro domain-containing protein [Candidatus Nanopelagicales bacterium]|jgi:O-acetyl-ADP-ribose deacetylase (regulator of RNase III)